jgi:integrase
MWSVRYYDVTVPRRGLRCASREEADFERARLVLAEARGEPAAASVVAADGGTGLTLAAFWPMYRADAESRRARSTLREYERIWDRRLGARFGRLRLDAIRPRPVSVVRKPRQGRQRAIDPFAPEDIERLRPVLLDDGDHRSATLVSVLAYAGLRPGEALGLEWRHVRDQTLLIEQAVSDGRLNLDPPQRLVIACEPGGVAATGVV